MSDDPEPKQPPEGRSPQTGDTDPSEEATRLRLEQAALSAMELIGTEGRSQVPQAGVEDPRTLAAVFESSPDAIVLFDTEGRIADWSPAAQRLLGFPRDRVLGRDLVELLFPRRLRSAIRSVIETRAVDWGEAAHRSIEVGVLHSSGEEVSAQLSLSWAAGSGLFAAHLRDATEQGDRERELASEARRRTRLLELGQLALGDRELGELTRLTLEAGSEEVGLQTFELWHADLEAGDLVLSRSRGGTVPIGTRVEPAPGSRLARALSSEGAAVITGDSLTPNPWLGPDDYREGTPVGIASILSGADGVLGVLSGAGATGGRFSAAQVSFFESLAQILAQAIERERSDRSLAEAENRLRTLVERLPVITYRAGLGPRGRWYYISPQVEEILGYSAEECLADSAWWDRLVHPDDFARVEREEQRAARESLELDIEYRMCARDGRVLWIRDRASAGQRLGDDGEVVVEGVLSDVSATKRAEARLRYLADHDDLTNVLNRRGFETAVDRWLGAADLESGAAIALIDLDHLKIVNDSLGHAAGDALLREIAGSITASLRHGDIFGRLSGDEFGLFIAGIAESTAERRVGELVESIRDSSRHGLSITASAGVTMVEGGQTLNATDLLVHADLALYRAKEKGRDRVVFSDDEDDGRLYWVSEVREAIEEERLTLYAQPIIDVETNAHYADELLVRMIDRDGRAVPAQQFIPTAERFGLIRRVDRWVLDQAVEIAARGGRTAVNISAASIADSQLTDRVGRRLQQAGVDPALLFFEITETVATPTIEILQAFSQRVERIGCKLSMDDAGTGFGTLTYLRNLNVSQLKIDMSFVRGVLRSETDRGIVRSIVMIAGELNLATVAEGVESRDVLAELRRLGVDYAQGFLLGEPRPVGPGSA